VAGAAGTGFAHAAGTAAAIAAGLVEDICGD
jgi:hypothetical protein